MSIRHMKLTPIRSAAIALVVCVIHLVLVRRACFAVLNDIEKRRAA